MGRQTRLYSDFDISFKKHPVTDDLVKRSDYSSVTQAIRNLIFMGHYEKKFRPEIGTNIRKMLFEPMDSITSQTLQEDILNTIKNYEPRAIVEDLQVIPNYEENGYQVELTYSLLNVTSPIRVNFFLSRVR